MVSAAVVSLAASAGIACAGSTTQDVSIGGLGATLELPQGDAIAAGAVIVAGSGPTDRDGNSILGLRTDTYRLLAEGLGAHGIASVRYDKRGVGASAALIQSEDKLTFDLLASDAVSVVAWAKQRLGDKPIFLIGHSEGGTVALAAAARAEPTGVALLAAPGRTLGAVLREQYSRTRMPAPVLAEARAAIAALEQGKEIPHVSPMLAPLFRPSVQPYLRSCINVEPVALARGLGLPLLVIGGGKDPQVGKSDFDQLSVAAPDTASYWDPLMAHTLKPAGRDAQSIRRTYTDPTLPLAVGLVNRIAGFILSGRE